MQTKSLTKIFFALFYVLIISNASAGIQHPSESEPSLGQATIGVKQHDKNKTTAFCTVTLIANGASSSLSIQNFSMITALNIASNFLGTALEGKVTETASSNCAALTAGDICVLTYTPGGTAVPLTNFTIQGSNTNKATASMVILSDIATLDVTPTTLLFAQNSSGTITVTNDASSAVPATNVLAHIPVGSNITVQSTTCGPTLAINANCSITFTSSTLEGPTTIPIYGDNTTKVNVSVTVTAKPIISITGPAQASRIITVNGAALNLNVTNSASSLVDALGITVTADAACPNITTDNSNCTSVAPGANCNLVINSPTPYLPCTITIGGTNTANSPTTLVAFSNVGGIVFQLGATNKVVSPSLLSSFWTASNTNITTTANAGFTNTQNIIADPSCSGSPGSCAAQICNNMGATWYLPAINEFTTIRNVLCPNVPPFPCNFGNFDPQLYFSSTQFDITNATAIDFTNGTTGAFPKNVETAEIRCVNTF